MATSAIGIVTPAARPDFISDTGTAEINQTEQTAQHVFRIPFQQEVFESGISPGSLLFNYDLNPNFLSPSLQEFAKNYEYYSFHNVVLHAQSTAPFGTSSGGIQIAHITDPENAHFDTAAKEENSPIGKLHNNLRKVVRQQDSVLLRPRESVELKIKTQGELFTFNAGHSRRFESFGSIVGVMRDPPAQGDSISFAFTLTGIAKFTRTCVSIQTLAVVQLYDDYELKVRVVPSADLKEFSLFAVDLKQDAFVLHDVNGKDVNLNFRNGIAQIDYQTAAQLMALDPGDDYTTVRHICNGTVRFNGSLAFQ